MTVNFEFIKHFLTNLASHISWGALEGFFRKIFEKMGDQVTPADVKYFMFKITGKLPLEDENLILRAKAELDVDESDIVIAHGEKVKQLDLKMQDYYRLTLTGYPDPKKSKEEDEKFRIEEAKKIIRMHAGMNQNDWDREREIMNYNLSQAESKWQRFKTRVTDNARQVWQILKRVAREVDRETDRWAQNAQDWIDTSSVMQSAREINQQRETRGFWKRLFGI